MTRWIDNMSSSDRAELRDAGRIGNARFAAPFSGAFVTDLDPREEEPPKDTPHEQMEIWPDD